MSIPQQKDITTVTTFTSCTKCLGSPGIIQDRMIAILLSGHRCMDDIALILKLRTWVIDLLDIFYFWHVIQGCLYNQALADVRSTDAGIRYMYWTSGQLLKFLLEFISYLDLWDTMCFNTVGNSEKCEFSYLTVRYSYSGILNLVMELMICFSCQ